MNPTEISKAAAAMGRKGGLAKTDAKTDAARANGAAGGRPSIDIGPMLAMISAEGDLCVSGYYRTAYPAEWRKARRLDRINVWKDDAGTEYVSVGRQM